MRASGTLVISCFLAWVVVMRVYLHVLSVLSHKVKGFSFTVNRMDYQSPMEPSEDTVFKAILAIGPHLH